MKQQATSRRALKRTALALVLGAVLVQGAAYAQSTSGGIYGSAPAGTSVTVTNQSGFSRTSTVDADGHYTLGNLPIGTYTVDAGAAGKKTVVVTVGGAVDASFSGDATTLGAVTVTGASVPKVDVTTTSTSTVITSEQLQRLPLGRSAEAIALLAPGAVSGKAGTFGSSVSFGGASVAENNYYINGFAVGNPMTNVGGYTLPYGSIDQQETYTGGYSAKYGRSDGGVISQVGKSGTNELHYGFQMTYAPAGLRNGNPDVFYPNQDFSAANSRVTAVNPDTGETYEYEYSNSALPGSLYDRGDKDKSWETTYSGYIGGALIQDKLFAFVSAETTKDEGHTYSSYGGNQMLSSNSSDPKYYVKLNWNINDNNLLEYTYMGEKYTSGGDYYDYDFDTDTLGGRSTLDNGDYVKAANVTERNEISVFKYTSFLTDNLTFNATYGRSRQSYVSSNPILDTGLAYVSGATNQNPAYTGGSTIYSPNTVAYSYTNARDYTNGLRADLEWVLGDHTLTFGMDNMKFESSNEGKEQGVDVWTYYHVADSTAAAYISPEYAAQYGGYMVRNYYFADASSMSSKQNAFYLEDKWQVTDNFLLTLGLRNDKFQNYNNVGEKFVDSGNQWAPRIGAAWDVFGDSSLKLFANAGRYYLALPNAVALRGASASTYQISYYGYTGIDANGVPTGLIPGYSYYANGEDGTAPDAKTVAPSDLESEYQDEYILGFEKTLGSNWKYGAKFTYRDLKQAIDDICDGSSLYNKVAATYGSDVADSVDIKGCYLANPSGNTFQLANLDADGNATGSYTSVQMTSADWNWPSPLKRTYKAADLFLERPFDGKWELRVDYTWSKLQGNSEGPANSDTGQGSDSHDNGVSTSQNWDAWQIMEDADGYLANDRRHQFKIRGAYALTDELLLTANVLIQSGSPVDCFGYYNPDGSIDETTAVDYGAADPIGYASSYHTCLSQAAVPGASYTPWVHRYNVGLQYAPSAFDHNLKLGLDVFNLFNEHKVTSVYQTSEDAPYTVSNTYNMIRTFETPRYIRFSVSYDY